MINGMLEQIVVNSRLAIPAVLEIFAPDFLIMKTNNFVNSQIYFPSRVYTDESGQPLVVAGSPYSKLALNDIVEIRLSNAQPNEQIEVIIRYA